MILGGVLAILAIRIMNHHGMQQKWHAAVFGTVVPFGVVITLFRNRWLRWSFWGALAICFGVHFIAIWLFFQYVLFKIQNFGFLIWLPIVFVEAFLLLVVVAKIEEKLTGNRERITLL
jgi:hypothetical protein